MICLACFCIMNSFFHHHMFQFVLIFVWHQSFGKAREGECNRCSNLALTCCVYCFASKDKAEYCVCVLVLSILWLYSLDLAFTVTIVQYISTIFSFVQIGRAHV